MALSANLLNALTRALALEGTQSFDIEHSQIPLTKAAVLVLINDFNNSITLTRRQDHMRQHAGQVAFAGGRMDETDIDLWQTAIREANEEIGLPKNHPLTKIGALPIHNTITNFSITPLVVINSTPFAYIPEHGEVADIFELPLPEIHPNNFREDRHEYLGEQRAFYVLPHEDFTIWGATARILHGLGKRLLHVHYL